MCGGLELNKYKWYSEKSFNKLKVVFNVFGNYLIDINQSFPWASSLLLHSLTTTTVLFFSFKALIMADSNRAAFYLNILIITNALFDHILFIIYSVIFIYTKFIISFITKINTLFWEFFLNNKQFQFNQL